MSSRIERRSRTGFTGATVAVGLPFLLTGAAMASWFARVPTVKAGFGLGDGAMGALLACVAVGSLIAMPLAGTMMARLGGRPVLAIAEALLCAALVLPALAPNPAALGIALTLLGAGHGLLDVTMNAQASALEQAAERALMPMLHALFSIGGFAGAMLGALFAHVGVSVAVHLGLVALLFAVLAVPAYRFVPHIHAPGGLAPSETAAPVLAWPGRGLAALAVISFCALMAEGVINDWSAIFLAQTLNAGPGFAPLGYAVFSVTMIIGRLAGGPLTHHIRPARLMGLGGVIVAGGVLLCVAATNGAVALAGFAVIGLGLASVFPLAVSAAGRRRDRPPATAVAAVATAGYSGFLVGPAVVGLLASLFGLRAGLAVLVLLGALVAGLCLRRHPTGGVE